VEEEPVDLVVRQRSQYQRLNGPALENHPDHPSGRWLFHLDEAIENDVEGCRASGGSVVEPLRENLTKLWNKLLECGRGLRTRRPTLLVGGRGTASSPRHRQRDSAEPAVQAYAPAARRSLEHPGP
jgi:hypothetical protein